MKRCEEEVMVAGRAVVAPASSTNRNKCVHDERIPATPRTTPIAADSSTSTDYDIPWRNYTDSERIHILNVLRRDVELRQIELERIR